MKMKIKFISMIMVLAMLMAFVPCIAGAETASGTCGENVNWTLDDNGTLTISGTGDMANYSYYPRPTWKSSSIKSVVIENGIESIGDFAFYSCDNLTSATISDSVVSIGKGAFNQCSALTNVRIPDNVTAIGDDAFAYCRSLTSIEIPDSIVSLGDSAFDQCAALTEAKIGKGITSIGRDMFRACSLTSITIPDSITAIGSYAFAGCDLTSITIPDSVISIGNNAFYNTTYYKEQSNWENGVLYIDSYLMNTNPDELPSEYIIKSGTKYIADGAFSDCGSLTSITLSDSLISIGKGGIYYGNNAFSQCSSLTSIDVDENNQNYSSLDGNLFNKDKTAIIQYAVGKQDTTYSIPDSVTTIGDSALSFCGNLKSITIPNSITTIEDYAFSECENLTDIYYSGSREQWDNIIIGNGNNSLNSANIRSNDIIDMGTCGTNAKWTLYNNYTLIVSGTGNMTNFNASPFDSKIKKVIIQEGITSIGSRAFSGCSGLTSVVIGDDVTSIGANAFLNCSALTDIKMGNKVRSILDHAFSGCRALPSIEIPRSLTSFGAGTFDYCAALEGVYITDLAAWCAISSEYYHSNPIYTAKKLYINNKLATDITIPDTVTRIGNYAFANCEDIRSVTIPDSVTQIDNYAFTGCGLNSIEISDKVTSLGNGVFSYCKNLENAKIGNHVNQIGEWVFNDCSSLKNVTIGDSIIGIGRFAFMGCNKLTNIIIPDSVTGIGEQAFSGCTAMENVKIGNGVKVIGNNSFLGCNSLANVTLGNSITKINNGAFSYCNILADIYYSGTETDWKTIEIQDNNEPLTSATIHYLKTTEPLEVTVTKTVDETTNTAIFTIKADEADRANELKDISLFVAEYDNGVLTKVTIGTKSEVSDGSITITVPLPNSQNYMYMLWDKNNSPLMDAITDINK